MTVPRVGRVLCGARRESEVERRRKRMRGRKSWRRGKERRKW